MMQTKYTFLLLLLFFTSLLTAQEVTDSIALQREARSLVREGNELYKQEKYTDASVSFKKALEKNSSYKKASYNLGNALYQQKNFKEALPQYEVTVKDSKDKYTKSEGFHNIGNSAMEQKQYQQAVDAYKNSLRNNPNDDETRYNLAVAQKELKKQKEKEKEKKDDKKKDNKDKKENKDKKGDKEKKDDKGDEKKDNKEKDDKKKDKKDGDQDKKDPKNPKKDKDQKSKPKPKKGTMTPQQIKQLLESLNNEEKKTQKKMNVKKSKGNKIKQEKDW
jgi:Ca-activated chloride channel family protein